MTRPAVRIRHDEILRIIREGGGRALVALVGVQTNQFPHAVDLALPFVKAGIPVCIGGFHVSGCIAMLPELPPDIKEAQDFGISLFAGEAEDGRLDEVFRDAWNGRLKPLYNHMDVLPSLEGQPTPMLPTDLVHKIHGFYSCMDLGRGCPYQCSFCTIINVQGRKSRSRSPDDVEKIIRENYALGIKRFFVTDDNFARNTAWEALFDRIIQMRSNGFKDIGFTLQVDTLCHKIPNFIEKAAQAGVQHTFIGLENINPDNLNGAKKRQNKITDYRVMLQKWRDHGVITLAGYILGFPADTKESILREVEIIKRELPLDILEFFILQPLPGSEDHKVLQAKGVWMDPDMNKYDVNHRVAHHARMTDAEWVDVYKLAWKNYYTPEHIRTLFRRTAANRRGQVGTLAWMIQTFSPSIPVERIHPLERGHRRLKYRLDRRRGMRLESPLLFYPRYFVGSAVKQLRYWLHNRMVERITREVLAAPDRWTYQDIATTPQADEEFASLDLYHATRGGEEAISRRRRDDAIRAGVHATI